MADDDDDDEFNSMDEDNDADKPLAGVVAAEEPFADDDGRDDDDLCSDSRISFFAIESSLNGIASSASRQFSTAFDSTRLNVARRANNERHCSNAVVR
jgi:hypothetical protein